MANELYGDLLRVVSGYIGDDRASQSLARQLEKGGVTPDSVTKSDLEGMMNFLIGGTTLYLHPDKEKQAELVEKLKALT